MDQQRLHADVRAATGEAMGQVAARIGQALNLTFTEREWDDRPAHFGRGLGFGLRLTAAGTRDNPEVELVAYTEVDVSSPFTDVDISPYVAGLLTTLTRLDWYVPSVEQIADERAAYRMATLWSDQWSRTDEERAAELNDG
ncbi:hypothetical protein [Actinoallomurus sp. CA-150999]|uniref:hypothetical protein n=1 Tax=Actinoallomurus sp. CA-150999 TaxID=3239887 RepID=UPI003D93E53F